MGLVSGIRLGAVLLLFVTACSGEKGKAEAAVAQADQAVSALPPDAAKILPYEAKALSDTVASARAQLTQGQYATATAAAEAVPAKAAALGSALSAKRTELSAALDTLGFAMKKNLGALQARLDDIAKTHHMPKGLDAAKLTGVKETVASATQEWAAIETQIQSGELADAMGRGMQLRSKVSEALAAVGLVADDPAWHNMELKPKP